MRVTTYTLDGKADRAVELTRSGGTIFVEDSPALAVSHWGAYMALTLIDRLVLVLVADYERLVGHACTLLRPPR